MSYSARLRGCDELIMFLNANRPMVNKASILNFIVPPWVKLFRVSDRTESTHAMYLIASSRLIPCANRRSKVFITFGRSFAVN